MRPREPRIAPLEAAEWDEEQREILAPMNRGGRVYNIFKTLVRYPKLLKRWSPFGSHVLFKSSLDPRHRELAILRIGWRCRATYEWSHHVEIGKGVGLSDAEIARVAAGPEAPGWIPLEAALLRAVDELRDDACIADATWAALARELSTEQLMDLVFTVGNYTLVSMALNSFGVRLEEGYVGIEHWERKPG
jgi:4-carboxymuconolactone decarboxylase